MFTQIKYLFIEDPKNALISLQCSLLTFEDTVLNFVKQNKAVPYLMCADESELMLSHVISYKYLVKKKNIWIQQLRGRRFKCTVKEKLYYYYLIESNLSTYVTPTVAIRVRNLPVLIYVICIQFFPQACLSAHFF